MLSRLENLLEYENKLRKLAKKCLNINIPTIPQNISPITEILFLEKLLNINGFGLEEKKCHEENKNLLINTLFEKYYCKYMFVKENVMRCSKGKFTNDKCKNKHDSYHCMKTIPLDKL